jgi:hypothetical protein
VTPVEKIGITVDDAPFLATEVTIENPGAEQLVVFKTNVGDTVIADTAHPVRVDVDKETGEPRPYILVRGRLEALIGRSVYYELIERGETTLTSDVSQCSITSRGVVFSLGEWPEG